MTTDTKTSVMLVDDHQVMRDLLRDALENTGEFQVVAQASAATTIWPEGSTAWSGSS